MKKDGLASRNLVHSKRNSTLYRSLLLLSFICFGLKQELALILDSESLKTVTKKLHELLVISLVSQLLSVMLFLHGFTAGNLFQLNIEDLKILSSGRSKFEVRLALWVVNCMPG